MTAEAPSRPTEIVHLSRSDCLALLASTPFGRLAVNSRTGTPVIRPVNYIFDERTQAVAFRTAEGSKLHGLLGRRRAAFEIDGTDPETRTGWSVIISGVTEEVSGAAEVRRLERMSLETWMPGAKPHWVRIRAWTVSGRRIVLPGEAAPQHWGQVAG